MLKPGAHREYLDHSGFSLIELLVVVAIIALLISILLPSLARAKAQARLTACQANLRSIGHGVGFYLHDSNGVLPAALTYGVGGYQRLSDVYHAPLGTMLPNNNRPLNRYLKQIDVFECPGDRGDPVIGADSFFEAHGTSYSYASHSKVPEELPDPQMMPPSYGIQSCRRHPTDASREGLPMGFIKRPFRKVVFLEPPLSPALADPASFPASPYPHYPETREEYRSVFAHNPQAHWHDRRRQHANVLFADFHVAFTLFNEEQINSVLLGPAGPANPGAPFDPGHQDRRYY